MDADPIEGVPQPKKFMYMPFPYTQRIKSPLPCDGRLLVFELSGTMFSSWATSFSQCVQIKDHLTILSLFVTLLQHCIDIGAGVVLETVVDKIDFWEINGGQLSHCVQPRSYRLWIPLTMHAVMSFCHDFSSKYFDYEPNDAEEAGHKTKRARNKYDNKTNRAKYAPIKTKQQLMAALRLYFGARKEIDNVFFGANDMGEEGGDSDSQTNPLHILNLLSADTYFNDKHVNKKHSQQRLHQAQWDLSRYISFTKLYPDSPESLLAFMPDEKVLGANLCRHIQMGPTGILKEARDIFRYLLPHFTPPRRLVLNKIYSVLDSIGEKIDASVATMSLDQIIKTTARSVGKDASEKMFSDPIDYSPIEVFNNDVSISSTDASAFQSFADRQLEEVYPVCSHLKHRNNRRIQGAARISLEEIRRVYATVVHEVNTLLSAKVKGVPCVYSELLKDTSHALGAFQDPVSVHDDKISIMTRKMFYQKTSIRDKGGYTGLGTRLLKIIIGASNCLRLLEQQAALLLLLYCRHFTTSSNQAGIGGGFFIICGPPDTGKSRACEQWLGCCSRSLRIENDGSSSKAYTANDTSQDLRCVYQDEIKELLVSGNDTSDAGSSTGIKARQTLLSRGFVRYKRLTQNPDTGKYENDEILVVSRVMLVGNTNALNSIPPAIQSRASVVPVIKDFSRRETKLSVNTLVASRDNATVQLWERSFMNCMQLISGLQGRFWQIEAFGGIPGGINDNLFVLFQLIFEKNHGIDVLPPRRCLDVKETAQGLLVMDLVTLWYSRGLGAKFGYDQVMEAMFYATRAVLRMEHITAAMWMLTRSTSLESHTLTVSQVIKGLVKMDGSFPCMTIDEDYFILSSSKRTLFNDIQHQLSHLGAGLVKQVLTHIQRGITNGLPNIKSTPNQAGQEQLLCNARYLSSILTPIEKVILDILDEHIKENNGVFLSYDEEFYVFNSAIRKAIYNVNQEDSTLHPKLRSFAVSQIRKSVLMLARRQLTTTKDQATTDSLAETTRKEVKVDMWLTPQSTDICKFAEANDDGSEPFQSKKGMFKVRGQKIAPLVVHKQLLQERNPKTTFSYDKTFQTALILAGGYKEESRVLLGPSPISDLHSIDHYVTMPPSPKNKRLVTVRNPFYTATGNVGMNMLFDNMDEMADPTNLTNEDMLPEDPMFPKADEYVTFTEYANLEDKIVKHRYKEIYNKDCPENFLPSFTNYI